MGNHRNSCGTCNAWNQNVYRLAGRRMRERYPDEYEQVREQVERDLYPQLIEDWDARMAALATEHLVDA